MTVRLNRGNISELGLGTELKIKGTIENVPCIVDGEESTKTVEYDTYFVCVAVDFLRTTKASSENGHIHLCLLVHQ